MRTQQLNAIYIIQAVIVSIGVTSAPFGCGSRPADVARDIESPRKDGEASAVTHNQTVQDKLSAIVASGPGIHAIKKDAQGRVVSFIACGQARVWDEAFDTPARAESVAEESALWMALAHAAEWLKEDVAVGKPGSSSTGDLTQHSEATLSNFHTLHVEVATHPENTIAVLVGFRPSARSPDDVTVQVRSEGKSHHVEGQSDESYTIFINGVRVVEEETRINSKTGIETGYKHYRQWRASGIPCLEIVCEGSESEGVRTTKAQGFRESGLEISGSNIGGPKTGQIQR